MKKIIKGLLLLLGVCLLCACSNIKNTESKINVDNNGFLTKESIKNKYGIKEKYVLLYISRILPYKGVDLLIENFKNVV